LGNCGAPLIDHSARRQYHRAAPRRGPRTGNTSGLARLAGIVLEALQVAVFGPDLADGNKGSGRRASYLSSSRAQFLVWRRNGLMESRYVRRRSLLHPLTRMVLTS